MVYLGTQINATEARSVEDPSKALLVAGFVSNLLGALDSLLQDTETISTQSQKQRTMTMSEVCLGIVLSLVVLFSHLSSQEQHSPSDAQMDIWDEKPGDPRFLHYDKTQQRLRCASLNQLVCKLTDPDNSDVLFMKKFLCTYSTFCTPQMLFMKLQQRFEVFSLSLFSLLSLFVLGSLVSQCQT